MAPRKKPQTVAEAEEALERLDEQQLRLNEKKAEAARLLRELREEEKKIELARQAQIRLDIVGSLMSLAECEDLDIFNTYSMERILNVLSTFLEERPGYFTPPDVEDTAEQQNTEPASESENHTETISEQVPQFPDSASPL